MIRKVCRLAWDYPYKGLSTFGLQPVFVGLSEAQVKQGYEVHVIALRNGEPSEEVCRGVHVHRVPAPFNVNSIRMIRKIVGTDPEWVVHSHATCGVALAASKYIRRFPLVCHVHGTSRSHHTPLKVKSGELSVDYDSLSVNYHMFRERIFWSSADRVLTVSAASKEDVTGFYRLPESMVKVVYNGVDADLFHPGIPPVLPERIANLQGKRIILYAGHFGLRKGIFFLVRAMAMVKKEVPDAHLVCIGGAPKWLKGMDYLSILRKTAESAGVVDSVTFLDAVPNPDLVNYYSSSEVFALPSYYETFSKVAVEAMACGKPVVATDAGGLREVVDQNQSGILVHFGSPSELARAIISIMQDGKMAKEMGRRGREKVEAMFTWDKVANRVTGVYDELSHRRP
ncbi:MAG: glycosyltransferase family 4 protein [Thaumarchaeota archaeon]|nr:glycosyltransferase family 4 protein [Nitrososphaerota archaeon]